MRQHIQELFLDTLSAMQPTYAVQFLEKRVIDVFANIFMFSFIFTWNDSARSKCALFVVLVVIFYYIFYIISTCELVS